ncbi:MAG: four helix bundle protein [Deltaproteobacteria bacterium]|nr:four helix bundle protein [Deltaproteobacteria bacterium]
MVWLMQHTRKFPKNQRFLMANLKMYNRLCKDLKLLAFNQYEYLAVALDEIGRLLGGWQKSLGVRS